MIILGDAYGGVVVEYRGVTILLLGSYATGNDSGFYFFR